MIVHTAGKYQVRQYIPRYPGQEIAYRIEWRGAWGIEESVRIYRWSDVLDTLREWARRDTFKTEKG